MPARSRWYLAAIGVLGLVLVAWHFSIQAHAQRKAQLLVQQWMHSSDLKVAHVRYQLLRNMLSLDGVDMSRNGARLHISHALLQSDPYSLSQGRPQLRSIMLSGVSAELLATGTPSQWVADPVLLRLWSKAQTISLSGRIALRFADGRPPLRFEQCRLRFENRTGVSNGQGRATLFGAPVSLSWKGNPAEPGSGMGSLEWTDVEADRVLPLGRSGEALGKVAGQLQWVLQAKREDVLLHGNIRRYRAGAMSASHALMWAGAYDSAGWELDLKAQSWPLDGWAGSLPQVGGYRLVAGEWSGDAKLVGQWGRDHWQLTSPKGDLQSVVLSRAGNGKGVSDWQLARVHFEDAGLNGTSKEASLGRLALSDVQAWFSPGDSQPPPASVAWKVDVHRVDMDRLVAGLNLAAGVVQLPPLDGIASRQEDGSLAFTLATPGHGEGRWLLHGRLHSGGEAMDGADFAVEARAVPLAQLRPLLPLLPKGGAFPVSLAGSVDMNLQVKVDRSDWEITGNAGADGARIAYGGDAWSAKRVSVDLDRVGTGLGLQLVHEIRVTGWRFVRPIQPIPPYRQAEEAAGGSWWKPGLRRGNWVIHRLSMQDGAFSLGRPELRWGTDMSVIMTDIGKGRWSTVDIEGEVGQARLQVKGEWEVLADTPHMVGKASIEGALPFVLGEWLTTSGAPRLVRGRVSLQLDIERAGSASYSGMVSLALRHAMVESGVFPNDPFITRLGYSSREALRRLRDAHDDIVLSSELAGSWQHDPISLAGMGDRLLELAHRRADVAGEAAKGGGAEHLETRLRLHQRRLLTLNERIRLKILARKAKRNPDWVIDLSPRLPEGDIDELQLQRIRFTQQLIETYLVGQGVGRQRIFPIWPTRTHPVSDLGAIQVWAGPPA